MADVKIRVLAEDKTKQGLKSIDSGFIKLIKSLGLAALATKALKEGFDFLKESTLLAARVETLGVVTRQLGKNAGYTSGEIRELERAIQAQGITTQASRQSLAKMMQAELDLADATDLARLAQDAAVIAGTNSSEAFSRLVDVISTGNVRMARTMGLQVDFNAGYQKMAEELGKTTAELTAQEKAQSRTNSVMEEGVQISGSYASAMDSVGKQVESTARYWEEYRVALGEANIESLGYVNRTWQKMLKAGTEDLKNKSLLHDALELSIITQLEYDGIMQQAVHNVVSLTDATEGLQSIVDGANDAIERANALQHEGLITKLALTAAELEHVAVVEDAAQSMWDLAAAERDAAIWAAIMAGDMELANWLIAVGGHADDAAQKVRDLITIAKEAGAEVAAKAYMTTAFDSYSGQSSYYGDTGYATGGEFTVLGSGGVDTTPVSFMATPGETVNIGGGTSDMENMLSEVKTLVRSLPTTIADALERR